MELLRSFFAQDTLYVWGAILILGIPGLILVLGELIERLQRQGNELAAELANFRNWVVPLLSIRLILQFILGVSSSHLIIRLVETALWLVMVYAVLHLLIVLVRGTGSTAAGATVIRLPRVWSELLRVGTVAGVAFYVLGALWGVPMDQVFAALGVGSIVVGFALQDTLSSLVAGTLLAFEKPFAVGDWLSYGGYEGQVVEMNWRAVRLRTRERDVLIVPNSLMGKDVVCNYTLLDPLHAERITVSFSYQHPPNQVKRMLMETALATPGVIQDPAPHIRVINYAYDKLAVDYEIKVFILDFLRTEQIRDEVLVRIYYAAQRYNFRIPAQTTVFYQRAGAELDPTDLFPELRQLLPTISYFAALAPSALDQLARGAAFHHFGAEEWLIQQGVLFTGFYIILEGQVRLMVWGQDQQRQEIALLGKNNFFGETVLLRERPSPYAVTVTQDLRALFINRATFLEVVETNPRLATEMTHFMEERAKLVRRATGSSEKGERAMASALNGLSH